MSDCKRLRHRSGDLRRVRCRVCRKEINFQSYSDHLELTHPEEDPKDRREFGQARLFGGVMAKKVVEHMPENTPEYKSENKSDEDEDVSMEETRETVDLQDKEDEEMLVPDREDSINEGGEEISVIKTKEVKDVILRMLERDGAQVSFEDCTTEEEKLNKCLLIVGKRMKVKQEASNLVAMLEDLKLVEGKEIDEKVEAKDVDTIVRLARNLEELLEVDVLKACEAGKGVVCVLCGTIFQSLVFRNLKVSLRRHLKLATHIEKGKEREQSALAEDKWEARNRSIGKTVGGLVYHLVHNGRPDSDLPKLIYRVKMAGGDVGDINHSHNLVGSLLPEISKAVKMRIKRFMNSPMVATGSLPPCNIMADKATDKRDSRHLVGILTLNPGGTTLFQAFFLGAPKCAGGSGEVLTNSIVDVVSDFVSSTQYRGFTGDGV